MMNGIFLLLGTNQGNRKLNLDTALAKLEAKRIKVLAKSSIYETAPWGISQQPEFLNIAVEVDTELGPEDLLLILKDIEKDMGRIETKKWGERLIDIDILYFKNKVVDLEHLKIPHPQIPNRKFTLAPLVDIAPYFIHPTLKSSQITLLQQCSDPLEVKRYTEKHSGSL